MRIVLFSILLSFSAFSIEKEGVFGGRISRNNEFAGLLRVRVDFSNIKYLNKRDKVEIWNELNPSRRCPAYVAGKSGQYLLVKVTNYDLCLTFLNFSVGQYHRYFSQDLINNLKMGKELVEVLVKKRLALEGKLRRGQQELDSYIEKVDAVNSRYEILREKLLREWREEIANLEEDRTVSLRNHTDTKLRLEEIQRKLEKYRIEDENLRVDRWALDPRLYYKK